MKNISVLGRAQTSFMCDTAHFGYAVMLTDSRCAIQHIVRPCPITGMIENIRSKARSPSQVLRYVTVQWVSSHDWKPRLSAWLGTLTNCPLLYHVHWILAVFTVICANYL